MANGNTSDNWKNVYVNSVFNADLIKHCKFFGLIRIGKLEPYFLEFNNLRTASRALQQHYRGVLTLVTM